MASKSSGAGIEGRLLGLEGVSLSGESATLSQSCSSRSSAGVRNGDLPSEALLDGFPSRNLACFLSRVTAGDGSGWRYAAWSSTCGKKMWAFLQDFSVP